MVQERGLWRYICKAGRGVRLRGGSRIHICNAIAVVFSGLGGVRLLGVMSKLRPCYFTDENKPDGLACKRWRVFCWGLYCI